MTTNEKTVVNSLELMKAGFANAQDRISFIDTKIGIIVGVLLVLLPAPLLVIGWATDLHDELAKHVYAACCTSRCLVVMIGLALFFGMCSTLIAMLYGISGLKPRGPKSYGKSGPFHNEWKPSVLFPIHNDEKACQFGDLLKTLATGVDLPFVVEHYEYQLCQLGDILHKKLHSMNVCINWLYCCVIGYSIATLLGVILALKYW